MSQSETEKEFMALVKKHMVDFKCSKAEALQAVMKENHELHRRWIEEANQER